MWQGQSFQPQLSQRDSPCSPSSTGTLHTCSTMPQCPLSTHIWLEKMERCCSTVWVLLCCRNQAELQEKKVTSLLPEYTLDVQKLIHIYTVMHLTGLPRFKRHIKGSAVKKGTVPCCKIKKTKGIEPSEHKKYLNWKSTHLPSIMALYYGAEMRVFPAHTGVGESQRRVMSRRGSTWCGLVHPRRFRQLLCSIAPQQRCHFMVNSVFWSGNYLLVQSQTDYNDFKVAVLCLSLSWVKKTQDLNHLYAYS